MKKAFALPTILLASTLLMIVLVVTAAATTSISKSLSDQQYNRQAKEAAQSALTYARYCYNQVSGKASAEQWPNIGELTPSTDCYGADAASTMCPSSPQTECSLTTAPNVRTTFSAWIISPASDGGASYTLDATGTVQVLRPSGGVARTYTRHLQQVVSINLYGIASGNDTTCSIQAGQLYCWGKNKSGQVGNGNKISPVTVPYHVGGLLAGKYVQYVATGISHTCAIAGATPNPTDGNTVYCWGDNSLGQFGNGGTSTGSSIPAVGGSGMSASRYIGCTTVNPDCTAISARDHTCVITENSANPGSTADVGEYCWGFDADGQAGLDRTTKITAPPIPATPTAKLKAGYYLQASDYSYVRPITIANVSGDFSCAINGSGAVYCWGSNRHGQFGNGTVTTTSPLAYKSNITSGATQIATNLSRVCALVSGQLYCWGESYYWSMDKSISPSATGAIVNVSTPTKLVTSGPLSGVALKAFAITDFSTCVVTSATGQVWCWGYNDEGQLGQGTTSGPTECYSVNPSCPTNGSQIPAGANTPVQVKGALSGQTVTQITSGNNHFCALTAVHTSYCWGDNSYGQLGNGTTDPGTSPKRVHIPATIIY